jgi:hypothetical protein
LSSSAVAISPIFTYPADNAQNVEKATVIKSSFPALASGNGMPFAIQLNQAVYENKWASGVYQKPAAAIKVYTASGGGAATLVKTLTIADLWTIGDGTNVCVEDKASNAAIRGGGNARESNGMGNKAAMKLSGLIMAQVHDADLGAGVTVEVRVQQYAFASTVGDTPSAGEHAAGTNFWPLSETTYTFTTTPTASSSSSSTTATCSGTKVPINRLAFTNGADPAITWNGNGWETTVDASNFYWKPTTAWSFDIDTPVKVDDLTTLKDDGTAEAVDANLPTVTLKTNAGTAQSAVGIAANAITGGDVFPTKTAVAQWTDIVAAKAAVDVMAVDASDETVCRASTKAAGTECNYRSTLDLGSAQTNANANFALLTGQDVVLTIPADSFSKVGDTSVCTEAVTLTIKLNKKDKTPPIFLQDLSKQVNEAAPIQKTDAVTLYFNELLKAQGVSDSDLVNKATHIKITDKNAADVTGFGIAYSDNTIAITKTSGWDPALSPYEFSFLKTASFCQDRHGNACQVGANGADFTFSVAIQPDAAVSWKTETDYTNLQKSTGTAPAMNTVASARHPQHQATDTAPNTAFSMQFLNVKQITALESDAKVELFVKGATTATKTWTAADIEVGLFNVLYMPAGDALTPSVTYCLAVSAGAIKDENGAASTAVTCADWEFTVACANSPYPTPTLLAYGVSSALRAQVRAPSCDANTHKPCIQTGQTDQTLSLLWSYPLDSLDSANAPTAFTGTLSQDKYSISMAFAADGNVACPANWIKFNVAGTATAQAASVCAVDAEVANAAFNTVAVEVKPAADWTVAAYVVNAYTDPSTQTTYDPTLYKFGYRAMADYDATTTTIAHPLLTGAKATPSEAVWDLTTTAAAGKYTGIVKDSDGVALAKISLASYPTVQNAEPTGFTAMLLLDQAVFRQGRCRSYRRCLHQARNSC